MQYLLLSKICYKTVCAELSFAIAHSHLGQNGGGFYMKSVIFALLGHISRIFAQSCAFEVFFFSHTNVFYFQLQ
jgi:hypothetical protein